MSPGDETLTHFHNSFPGTRCRKINTNRVHLSGRAGSQGALAPRKEERPCSWGEGLAPAGTTLCPGSSPCTWAPSRLEPHSCHLLTPGRVAQAACPGGYQLLLPKAAILSLFLVTTLWTESTCSSMRQAAGLDGHGDQVGEQAEINGKLTTSEGMSNASSCSPEKMSYRW